MMPLKVISSQTLLAPTVYEIEHIKKYRLLNDDRKCAIGLTIDALLTVQSLEQRESQFKLINKEADS